MKSRNLFFRGILEDNQAPKMMFGEEPKVRLEKMKVPTFGGDIRAFARFKADSSTKLCK